jgi:pyridoxal phosphate enzyme (YggS family)
VDAGAAPSPPDPAEVAALTAARDVVIDRIARACAISGRDPAGVTLVAVSKTVPPARLRAAVAAGLTLLGENRVQEALEKVGTVPGARWTLVGPLQSNKARRAVEAFESIQTLDSVELGRRLDRLAGELRTAPLPVLVQVNVDADPGKVGFSPTAVEAALPELLALPSLRLEGLMSIGRLVADAEAARPTFQALRALSEALRGRFGGLGGALSMGMSDDYPVAVEEGATIVRVGRALFGERPHH